MKVKQRTRTFPGSKCLYRDKKVRRFARKYFSSLLTVLLRPNQTLNPQGSLLILYAGR